ncbi:MAG: 4Fe-4S binding protein [Clostridiales bacterium]|nr:4Fe-4S binding protein [Clostridiales bacterium]
MARVTFEKDKCKGCGLCIEACPKKILQLSEDEINLRGYYPAMIIDQDKCIACSFCAIMCPDCIITVEK